MSRQGISFRCYKKVIMISKKEIKKEIKKFFATDLDSFAYLQLVSDLEKKFEVELTMAEALTADSVEKFAKIICCKLKKKS